MLEMKTIPISLYIHTPWCVRKCPYCDFNSHAAKGSLPEDEYLKALLRDWNSKSDALQDRPLKSIFIGGGTPSLLSPNFYKHLLSEIQKTAVFVENIEITLEANPGTVEQERFIGFRLSGINRISLGIQSFDPEQLKALGRIHSSDEAKKAILAAKNAGFHNINLDLMHGLPKQTLERALLDLETAFSFSTPHISWYQLTLEPNTIFHKFPPTLPQDDVIASIQEKGQARLLEKGFEQYEVSAFTQNQQYCKHNLNYWEFGDYIGIGAGAHGKITDEKKGLIRRTLNLKHPALYLKSEVLLQEEKILLPEELPLEFMLNALRLYRAIPMTLFSERTGLSWQAIQKPLDLAVQEKLISINATHIQTTDLGKKFLNNALEHFL